MISDSFSEVQQLRKKTRQQYRYNAEDKILLYVGRPVKRKGFHDVLSAWSNYFNRLGYHLMVVGVSQEDVSLMKLNLSSNVHCYGYQADPTQYHLVADILCAPSYHEGLSYCYLEAAASGCIHICANIPEPMDFVVNKYNGFVCSASNTESIGKVISKVCSSLDLRSIIFRNAFLTAKNYDRKVLLPLICSELNKSFWC